jgi:hypothetical protein
MLRDGVAQDLTRGASKSIINCEMWWYVSGLSKPPHSYPTLRGGESLVFQPIKATSFRFNTVLGTIERRLRRRGLLDVLFLGLLSLYVILGRNAVPFHGDEATFVAMSRDYHKLIYEQDFAWFSYHEPVLSQYDHERLIRLTVGPISYFTIGLAWDLSGMTVRDLNSFWDWTGDRSVNTAPYQTNRARGNLPTQQLLRAARTPSTLFLALSIVVVFSIAKRLTRSRLAAYAAALIYATTPAVLVNGQRAMQEGAMLFTTGLTALLTLKVIEAQREQAKENLVPVEWYAGLGLTSGLALASKHLSLLVVMAALLIVFLAPLFPRGEQQHGVTQFNWRHICAVTGAAVAAIALFCLLLPAWWSWGRLAVLGGLASFLLSLGWEHEDWRIWMVRGVSILLVASVGLLHPTVWSELAELSTTTVGLRHAIMARQAADYGQLHSVGQRLVFLLRQAFWARPQYFEVASWRGIEEIADQIADYERTALAGRGGGFGWAAILGMLFAAGLWALVTQRFKRNCLFLALWLFLPALALLALNTLPWQRYYLVLHAPIAVFSSLGLWKIRQGMVDMRRKASWGQRRR